MTLWAAGLAACLSPTLPLPPPEEPTSISASAEDGYWDVRGQCTPGAVVLVKNIATGVIAGTEDDDADGRYLVRLEGDVCDPAEVTEIIESESSPATFFVLQPVTNSTPDDSCQLPQ
ncbi:MAG: hypothetical protein RIF41_38905 [Polyangiaceae bacterium]